MKTKERIEAPSSAVSVFLWYIPRIHPYPATSIHTQTSCKEWYSVPVGGSKESTIGEICSSQGIHPQASQCRALLETFSQQGR